MARLAMASCHGGLRPRRPASRDTARSMDAAGAARSEDYHGLRDARGAGPDVWGSRALRQKTRERAPAPARLRNRAGLLLAAGSCPPLVNPGRDGEVGRAVALRSAVLADLQARPGPRAWPPHARATPTEPPDGRRRRRGAAGAAAGARRAPRAVDDDLWSCLASRITAGLVAPHEHVRACFAPPRDAGRDQAAAAPWPG